MAVWLRIRSAKFEFIYGKGTIIHMKSALALRQGSKCMLGDNVLISSESSGYHAGMPFNARLYVESGGALCIGNNTRINGACIHAKKSITIGETCVIASGVNILDSNGHVVASLDRTVDGDVALPIVIGNNVWIGINAVILKGTIIGDNCVVQAGAVVSGIFPPNSVIGHDKAKILYKINYLL